MEVDLVLKNIHVYNYYPEYYHKVFIIYRYLSEFTSGKLTIVQSKSMGK